MSKVIGGFELVNEEKHQRAIFGMTGREGKLQGGVGENATPEVVRAEYDRLGGLIRKDGKKVKTGAFWDVENKKVRETPKVIFVFRDLNGVEVEVEEGKEVPLEVVAAQVVKAKRGRKAKVDEDDE